MGEMSSVSKSKDTFGAAGIKNEISNMAFINFKKKKKRKRSGLHHQFLRGIKQINRKTFLNTSGDS